MMDFELARHNMIEQQIRTWDVLDAEVLALLSRVKREDFVPAVYRSLAFADLELPIGHGRKMWQPKLEARVIQELMPAREDRVLEIGTGSGYLTALLAARSLHVTSVEIEAELSAEAARRLARQDINNVSLVVGDGSRGWADKAPYDLIVFTASTPVLPREALAQLKPHGRLFAVVGDAPVMRAQRVTALKNQQYQVETLFETCLDPLVNALEPERFVF
jgi:protein-L-isoaspartate(D-aspartate) O-methyltransferase